MKHTRTRTSSEHIHTLVGAVVQSLWRHWLFWCLSQYHLCMHSNGCCLSRSLSLSLTLFLSYVCVCVCCWTLNHYLSIFFLYFYSLNSLRNCHSPYNYINISTMQRAQGTNIGTAIVFIHWLQCRYIHSCLAACLLLNTFRSKLFTTRLNEPLSNGRTGHSHCHWDHDHSNTHFIVNSSDIPRICLFCALMINTLHLCVLSLIGHLNGKYKIEQNSTNITD